MLTAILKIILCSSLFIAVYYLFLEKEKIYRFNRFYLLSSLIFSYIIPFITITVQSAEVKNNPQLIIEETAQQIVLSQGDRIDFNWINILWLLYAIITLFLFIKSIIAIIKIQRIQGEKRSYYHYNIVLTEKNTSPFSFWGTIYIGKKYVKNNIIDPRIFIHEKSHLDQKHSIDLAIVQLINIFTWFNPTLFLYKKAIVTNHEFLADEAVLHNKFSIKEYQNLILEEIQNSQNLPLTHSFNFNNTKKRFIMMKAKKTKFSLLRKTAGITALAVATILFSERIYANSSVKNERHQQENHITAPEYRKEDSKPISDTISPRKNTQIKDNTNIIPAQYPDGLMSLRTKVSKIMDTGALEPLNGTITATAYLHIDDLGKMTNVTVSGNNETFNKEFLKTVTAISNETIWKPATKDGKAIASVLKLPATMTFIRP
ncbi:M56 family metallopeptidase [Chryseobacterium joostei]|uniref:M56 family metallopeptidase n=1 Tax=Chryseobacterium joostei TaxID=112234 RepID=UPI0023EFB980|nr:M56 family metallopeptidase [Chryseobacterium joostei]